jgi:dihydrodipicolinate synthase/N-acetylneuraminate lyase
MKQKRKVDLAAGVYAALATPRRRASVEADTAALLDYLDVIVRAGVNGLVLFGSTGEFVHFDTTERMRVCSLAIKRSRAPVLVNVSHSTLDGALLLAESACGSGASGLMLMPPYFYRYNDHQIADFYMQFVQEFGGQLPVYLYNLPFFTNPISPEVAAPLLETGLFAGIKDSSGDWGRFENLLAVRRVREFRLLAGHESIYLKARLEGADGIVSGVAAAVPELMIALDRAASAQDLPRAQQLNERLLEFLPWVERFPSTVAIKQAAVARGWKQQHLAVPVDAAKIDEYHAWLSEWLPQVLRECAG